MSQSFDVIILGSGPAGQKAALNASKLGKKVALIDRVESLGGVCIHTGTIPSKAMREAVLHLTGMNLRQVYGESYAVKDNITMSDLLYRCQHVVKTETEVIRSQMRRNHIAVFYGMAAFTGPHTVSVTRADGEKQELHGEKILVAVGTEPARPANVPFTPNRVIDSTELLTLTDLPESMIIVGGGVIGVEYACMMAAVGVKVTILESRGRLLEFIDEELTEALQFRLRDGGVRLRLSESVAKIEVADDAVIATTASNKSLHAQTLLYCIGRQGATANLGLETAGLAADNRGRLKVNEHMQTEVPHIYAAGDVIGFPALAATSMEQGRQASNHMFGQYMAETSPLYPLGIYTIPEISLVGQTEQQLTAAGTPYEVGIARYREIARGQLIADPNGLLKILFHPQSRRVLGVHAIGTGATELIHIGQTVMAAGMPIDYFADTVFNYPTLAECYKVAALDGINRVRTLPAEPVPVDTEMTVDASGDVKIAA